MQASKQAVKFKGRETCATMDINPPTGNEVPLDVARELLIAISQSSPDDARKLDTKSQKTTELNGDNVDETMNIDGSKEELRWELISISYVPSPDEIELPSMDIPES